MNDVEKQIIIEMAKNNMNVSAVANEIGYDRRTIWRYVKRIKKKTGLDCKVFYDLVRLLKIAGEEL